MIQQINHIGIAVKSLEERMPFYRDVLQLPFLGIETVPEQRVRVAMFQCGEAKIELLEPIADDSPIARFIEKRGEGIHHIAFGTDDVSGAISRLRDHDIRMIDERPRMGAHGAKIAFLHPAATGGVLTELCQPGEEGK